MSVFERNRGASKLSRILCGITLEYRMLGLCAIRTRKNRFDHRSRRFAARSRTNRIFLFSGTCRKFAFWSTRAFKTRIIRIISIDARTGAVMTNFGERKQNVPRLPRKLAPNRKQSEQKLFAYALSVGPHCLELMSFSSSRALIYIYIYIGINQVYLEVIYDRRRAFRSIFRVRCANAVRVWPEQDEFRNTHMLFQAIRYFENSKSCVGEPIHVDTAFGNFVFCANPQSRES